MAKLLIIDDHTEMVRLLQQQMENLNPRFTESNTFYFSGSDNDFRLCSMEEGGCAPGRTSMSGKKEQVFAAVFDFLAEHIKEQVLILIDLLLNSAAVGAPSYQQYRADGEYSCELYAELMCAKNGKKQQQEISPENLCFLIYSRSDAGIGVAASALAALPEDKKYFPKECSMWQNISWCRNRCDTTDAHGQVAPTDENGQNPLLLPRSYRDYCKIMK